MTRSEPGARVLPDPRSPTDRRQRDGLGLLPRSTSISERQVRAGINRLIGWLLMVLGLTSWSAGLIYAHRSETASALLGPALGLYIATHGLRLVVWRDRRKADRRRSERSVIADHTPRPSVLASGCGRRFQFRRPRGPKGTPGEDMQVLPPEVE